MTAETGSTAHACAEQHSMDWNLGCDTLAAAILIAEIIRYSQPLERRVLVVLAVAILCVASRLLAGH